MRSTASTQEPSSATPTRSAQAQCSRCQATVGFAELLIFARRTICPACHGELSATLRTPAGSPNLLPHTVRPVWQNILVQLAQARITLALSRCIGYGITFAYLGPYPDYQYTFITVALVAVFAADQLTWLTFRLLDLPEDVKTFPVESLITLGSGTGIIAWQGLLPSLAEAQITTVAMGFPIFLVVILGKTASRMFVRSVKG